MPRWTEHERANLPKIPDEETYYVYGFYDEENLFYIGKGRSYRCTQHFSNHSLKENTPKNNKIKKINREGRKVDVEFFAIHLTEYEALLLEKSLIETYGVRGDGGQLTNLRYGSLDSAGIWTEDRKKEHSVRLRGKNSDVSEDLVKKAKCLSYYCGFTAKEITQHPDFIGYKLAPHTVKAWCRGDKFSYVLPHLNHDRSTIREEKYQEFINLYEKGYAHKNIADILGLDYGLTKHYNTCYRKELSKEDNCENS